MGRSLARGAPGTGPRALRRAEESPASCRPTLLALAGSLVLLHGTGHPRDIDLDHLPLFLLVVPNIDESTRTVLDPPMWSLHVEVTFYLVLPSIGWALMRMARRRQLSGPLALCLALAGASVGWIALGYAAGWEPEVTWTLPTYLGAFACGIGAAVLAHGRRLGPAGSLALLAAGGTAVLLDAKWHSAGETGATARLLATQPLRFLGVASWMLVEQPALRWSARVTQRGGRGPKPTPALESART